ncbi:hypothetical protein [Bacillus sp. Au-Bac7]|uniref:hypothetical protein n=1 Tax=Bacillus sp. Au-Bac7 TaxID=2906458 RepID=UPI001E5D58B7|nr:hypothetical protein [Bacillus sp. Au-Bac7]MCE4051688.1 hypothetical protein [Bacillus sp. Au-Bac7]
MIDGSIMTTGRIFISFFMIALMLGVAVFLFQLQQVNNYKQYVNYQIERNGGLTETAVENINTYSEDHFQNVFSVSSAKLNEKVPYGSIVEYKVEGNFSLMYWDLEPITLSNTGAALSLVK